MSVSPNPNGPPPKFPLSQLNPGPETQEDWDRFIRWLLLFWQKFQNSSQSVEVQQALPAPTPYPILQPLPRYITFEFDVLGPNTQTNDLRIQLPAASAPLALDACAVVAHQNGAGLYDLQTSPDQVTWTSILTTPLVFAKGAFHTATVLTFAPGALLVPGTWIKAIVAAGSDITALQVALQLMVS